jgi:hypothetical protein
VPFQPVKHVQLLGEEHMPCTHAGEQTGCEQSPAWKQQRTELQIPGITKQLLFLTVQPNAQLQLFGDTHWPLFRQGDAQ